MGISQDPLCGGLSNQLSFANKLFFQSQASSLDLYKMLFLGGLALW